MKRHKLSVTELEKELKHIAEIGIQADYRRIKEDMWRPQMNKSNQNRHNHHISGCLRGLSA